MDEANIERALGYDHSQGTEEFREDLLQRCLAVLAAGAEIHHGGGLPYPAQVAELDDDALDMLAAAGDAYTRQGEEPQN